MTNDSSRHRLLGLFPSSRSRALALVAALAVLVVAAVGANAILAGSPSNFESDDGNMVHTGTNHDWDNVDFDHVTDVAQSTSDNSFTPGQKQDTTCPSIEGHKNPNKDDFTDVASFSETASGGTFDGHTFLYGATIRVAANGNASENVELKQGTSGLCPGQPAGGLLARTPGDKLIAIDYLNGGTDVQFHVLTWVGSGTCFVGNDSPPCWGATVLELSDSDAEGAASQAVIAAGDNPINGLRLVAGKFAEFGIDLSGDANIIPPGSCESFPQTVWESRSSGSSFVSSTKDITIENNTISNCGEVIIHKHTDPRGDDQDFGYTSDLAGGELSCSQDTVADSGDSADSWDLNDNGNTTSDNAANTQDCTNVPAGDYTVNEDDPALDGYSLTDISCDTGDNSSATPDVANLLVDISVAAGETVECTFTNTPLEGALVIQKQSTKTGNPAVANAGAEFCYDAAVDCSTTNVTDTDDGTLGDEDTAVGSVCVSGLTPGEYFVNETKAPDGYGDAGATEANQSVTVVAGTDCGNSLPDAGATATFTNPPLSDIQVRFRDGGSGETSATSITCDNTTGTANDNNTTGWDDTHTVEGVEAPTTIECTIVIDP
jgi:hypothetical protein